MSNKTQTASPVAGNDTPAMAAAALAGSSQAADAARHVAQQVLQADFGAKSPAEILKEAQDVAKAAQAAQAAQAAEAPGMLGMIWSQTKGYLFAGLAGAAVGGAAVALYDRKKVVPAEREAARQLGYQQGLEALPAPADALDAA